MAIDSILRLRWLSILCVVCLVISQGHLVLSFSSSRNDNLAVYWGQDGANHQQNLGFYCEDDTIDAIPLAFLYIFFGQGGQPVIDFANICSAGGNNFPGTDLADCSFMAGDIQKCQAKGKILTISLGGADAKVGFNSDGQAADFAHTIWNMFLGGNGPMRPFGDAVLDGVDLDIENGSSAHYNTFVNTIRSLAQNSKKRYYVTAAPQCPFPDAELGSTLNSAFFDAVYVQFYNNFCETSVPSEFNMGTWDHWAKTQSANKDIRVYLGAPASPAAAGNGYVSSQTLVNVARDAQSKYSSFGGVMLWDADAAQNNGQFQVAVKNGISNRSGNGPPDTQNPAPSPGPKTTKPGTTATPPQHGTTAKPPPHGTTVQSPNQPIPTTPTDPTPTSVSPTPSVLPDPRKSGRVRPQRREDRDVSHPLTITARRRNSRLFRF